MPKPLPPYFWENVKKDYEMGLSKTEICKKHKILPSTLSMRIKRNNWVISQAQKDALYDFQRADLRVQKNINRLEKKSVIIKKVQLRNKDYMTL